MNQGKSHCLWEYKGRRRWRHGIFIYIFEGTSTFLSIIGGCLAHPNLCICHIFSSSQCWRVENLCLHEGISCYPLVVAGFKQGNTAELHMNCRKSRLWPAAWDVLGLLEMSTLHYFDTRYWSVTIFFTSSTLVLCFSMIAISINVKVTIMIVS